MYTHAPRLAGWWPILPLSPVREKKKGYTDRPTPSFFLFVQTSKSALNFKLIGLYTTNFVSYAIEYKVHWRNLFQLTVNAMQHVNEVGITINDAYLFLFCSLCLSVCLCVGDCAGVAPLFVSIAVIQQTGWLETYLVIGRDKTLELALSPFVHTWSIIVSTSLLFFSLS